MDCDLVQSFHPAGTKQISTMDMHLTPTTHTMNGWRWGAISLTQHLITTNRIEIYPNNYKIGITTWEIGITASKCGAVVKIATNCCQMDLTR